MRKKGRFFVKLVLGHINLRVLPEVLPQGAGPGFGSPNDKG
jgi:hypothetical protein